MEDPRGLYDSDGLIHSPSDIELRERLTTAEARTDDMQRQLRKALLQVAALSAALALEDPIAAPRRVRSKPAAERRPRPHVVVGSLEHEIPGLPPPLLMPDLLDEVRETRLTGRSRRQRAVRIAAGTEPPGGDDAGPAGRARSAEPGQNPAGVDQTAATVASAPIQRIIESPPAPWAPPPPTPWERAVEPRLAPPRSAGEPVRRSAPMHPMPRSEARSDLFERPSVRLSPAEPSFTPLPPTSTPMIQMSLAPAVAVLLAIVAALAVYLLVVRTG